MGKRDIIRYINKQFLTEEDEVANEIRVSICVNGEEISGLMALPDELEELAIGFLFSECRIDQPLDVESITLDKTSTQIHITTRDKTQKFQHDLLLTVTSGCGRNVSRISKAYLEKFKPLCSDSSHSVTEIIDSVRQLTRSSDLFRNTGGVHTVGLWFENRFQWICDDIGRHNAFDKVIGHALREKWPVAEGAMIVSTGRISSDIVLKTIRAGIPMLISRSAPTENAIRIAETHGITLVGFVRGERFNIYSHANRIRIS